MSIVNYKPEHFETSHLLLDDEIADPHSVFENLFIDFRLWELKNYLWDAQEACMLTDIPPFNEIEGREQCLFYTVNIMKCLEAAKLIVDQRKAATTPDPNDPIIKYKDIDSLTTFQMTAAASYFTDRAVYHVNKLNEIRQYMTRIRDRLKEAEKAESTMQN